MTDREVCEAAALDEHLVRILDRSDAPGSGAGRYAAAMHFYARKMITLEMLEIYRMCSKFDKDDPIAVAIYENVALPPLVTGKQNTGKS